MEAILTVSCLVGSRTASNQTAAELPASLLSPLLSILLQYCRRIRRRFLSVSAATPVMASMKRSVDNEQSKVHSIILEAMMGCCEAFLISRLPKHDVSNLQLEASSQASMQIADPSLQQVRKVMRKTWGRRAHSPCTLEILLATPPSSADGAWDEVLLERLVLAYRAHAVTAQGVDTSAGAAPQHTQQGTVDKRRVYQRMCVLVRSVLCLVKALPALRVASQLADLLPAGGGNPTALRTPHLRFRIIVSHPSDPSKHAVHFSKSTPTRAVPLHEMGTPFGVLEASVTYALDTAGRAADAVRAFKQHSASTSMASSVAVAKHPHGNTALQGRTSAARPLSTAIIADYAGPGGVNAPARSAADAPSHDAAVPLHPSPAVPPALPESSLDDLRLPPAPAAGATSHSAVSSPRAITAATFTPHFGGLAGPSLKGGGGGAGAPTSLPDELHLPRASAPSKGSLLGSMGAAWSSPQQGSLVMDSMAPAGAHPSPLVAPCPAPAHAAPTPLGTGGGAQTPDTPSSHGSVGLPGIWGGQAVHTPVLSPSSMGGGPAVSPPPVGAIPDERQSTAAPFAALSGAAVGTKTLSGAPSASAGSAPPRTLFSALQQAPAGTPATSKVPVLSKAHAEGQRVIALAGAASADAVTRQAKPRGMVPSTSRGQLLEIIDETHTGGGDSPPRPNPASEHPTTAQASRTGLAVQGSAPLGSGVSPFAALAGGGAQRGGAAALGRALLLCDAALHGTPAPMHTSTGTTSVHVSTVAEAKVALHFQS